MKDLGMITLFLALVGLLVWWNVYAFADCKRVGHSTIYCIGRIGK